MKKLILFFAFFISLNILAKPKYIKYNNGDVELVETVENNKKKGPYRYYVKNGLIEEGTYINGKREGSYKLYDENGQIRVEGTYRNGRKEGTYKEYYENGQIKEEGTYKNGQRIE